MQYRGSLGEALIHILIMGNSLIHTKIARTLIRWEIMYIYNMYTYRKSPLQNLPTYTLIQILIMGNSLIHTKIARTLIRYSLPHKGDREACARQNG